MFKYTLSSLLSGIVLVAAISAITFTLLASTAGNVAANTLGPNATAADIEARNEQLGLDRPIVVQFLAWVTRAVQGNLGTSWYTNEAVSAALAPRIPVTLSILIGALIFSAIVSATLGILAASRGGWVDRVVQIISVAGYAIPGFLVALFLVVIFAVQLKIFPATGFIPLTKSVPGWLSTTTLPILGLSLAMIAATTQQIRSAILEVLQKDFVRTLRARGVSEPRILFAHALQNAAPPAISVLALQFVGLLGGAVVVETMFSLPGLGNFAVSETSKGDIPMVMGVVIVSVVIVVVVNFLTDILIGWLNPKARAA